MRQKSQYVFLALPILIILCILSPVGAQTQSNQQLHSLKKDDAVIQITSLERSPVAVDNEQLFRRLGKDKIDIDYNDKYLFNIIDEFRELGINLVLTENAINNGITDDDTISLNLKNVPIRTALKLMLEQKGATYYLRDAVIYIISINDAEDPGYLGRRVYGVHSLLEDLYPDTSEPDACKKLEELIVANVATTDWENTSEFGAGVVSAVGSRLVVVQTQENLYQVDDFLRELINKTRNP